MTRKARDHNRTVILDALPGTRRDVQERTGLSKTTVQGWITRLHKDRVIRISKWVKPTPTSIPTAFYRLGSAPDAVCRIKPLTNREKVYRWRRRLKQRDPEAYDLLMKKSLARIWEYRAKTGRRDPLMAAFYGQPNTSYEETTQTVPSKADTHTDARQHAHRLGRADGAATPDPTQRGLDGQQ